MKKQSIIGIAALLVLAVVLIVTNVVGARTRTQSPVANAGPDQTITASSTTLSGSATDADGTISGYRWREMSGPNTATFTDSNSASTAVSNLIVGKYKFRLIVTDNAGATDSDDIYVTVASVNGGGGTGSDPYGGTAWAIPGTIQAEDFDLGGEGVGYHDIWDTTNQGGQYRPNDNVDIELATGDSSGTYDVGWINPGEWLKYTVNVQTAGTYTFQVRVSSPYAGKTFQVEVDGSVVATLTAPQTSSWQTWQDASATFALAAGTHSLRLIFTDGSININYVTFSTSSAPSNQTPTANAGADQSITLPTSSATLSGSGTDSDGTIASYAWSQVSGPSTASIGSASNASTTVSNLVEGTYTFRLKVTDNAGATATDDMNIVVNAAPVTPPSSGPYGGTAWAIPGTIQAEDFDLGGEGVGYHDNDIANQGGQYRTAESVDITAAQDVDGGYLVGWTQTGEWTSYTVKVQTTGMYAIQARVAAASLAGSLQISIDGTAVATLPVPVTGGWQTWQTASVLNVPLTQGVHTMRITNTVGGNNINYFVFSVAAPNQTPTANAGADQSITLPTSSATLSGSGTDSDGTIASYAWSQVSGPSTASIGSAANATTNVSNLIAGTYAFRLTVTDNAGATATDDVLVAVNQAVTPPTSGSPYGGTAWAIPGTIQAEDFDLGGEGVGYHDTDTANLGGKYRTTEAVDIETSYDASGSYDVGWTQAGEWMNYTINVATTGTYVIQARVAAATRTTTMQVSIDGAQVATLAVPITGGYQIWQTVSALNVPLTQGVHTMRVTNVNGGNNINYFTITDNAAPIVDAGKDQSITLPANSVTLSGTATDVDGSIAKYAWTKVSGGAAIIASPSSASTSISGLQQGPYLFRLTATDNKGATGSADVTVMVYGQPGSHIDINPDTMVINENAVGDETKLFDEQNTLQLDANGNPVASTTNPIACPDFWNEPAGHHACWSLYDTGGIRDIVWPATLVIDLKATYNVTDAYVFIEGASANGAEDDFEIRSSDDPFNFTTKIGGTKFQTASYPYMQWIRIPLTANNNRYLQLKITSGMGKVGEIAFYGTKTGQTVADTTPAPIVQPQHYTMDKFIGTNVSWGMGDGYDRDYDMQWGTLRTYSGLRWIFDKSDNLQLGSPGQYSYDLLRRQLNAGTGEKPYNVEMGASLSMVDPNDPIYTSNSSFTDRKPIDYTLCQGSILVNNVPSCHGVADKPESYAHKAALLKKLAADAYGPTNGVFKEEFIETGNEPDGSWNQAGYFTPYELAAMMSADYDGHCDTLRYNGDHVGIKNGDPNLKVLMPGIVAMGSGDMRYLKAMNFWWQHHRTCAPTIPTDAINFHFYSSSSGGQGTARGHGISPEDYGMREMMKKTVDFRNKYAPKADVAVTEFGYDAYPETFPTDGASWCQGAIEGGSIIGVPTIGSYSPDEVQGQWITRSYLEMAAAGIDFSNQFWLADEYKLNTVCGTFAASGVLKQILDAINWRPQYTPRPGWYYAQTLKTQLAGMKYESDHDVNGIRVMKFRNTTDTKKVAYAVWSPTSTGYVNNAFSVPFDAPGIATPVTLTTTSETGVVGTATASPVQSLTVPVSERPTIVLVTE